jgi:hypothetical protein
MPIFTLAATAALSVAGITSTFIDEAEIVEVNESPDQDEGDDE